MIIEDFLKQTTPLVGTSYYFYFTKITKVNCTLPIKYASDHLIKYKDIKYRKPMVDYTEQKEKMMELYQKYVQIVYRG